MNRFPLLVHASPLLLFFFRCWDGTVKLRLFWNGGGGDGDALSHGRLYPTMLCTVNVTEERSLGLRRRSMVSVVLGLVSLLFQSLPPSPPPVCISFLSLIYVIRDIPFDISFLSLTRQKSNYSHND